VARRPSRRQLPCPSPGERPPIGPGWIHEIKRDGFRIMARRADGRVRLLTRKGYLEPLP